jgi:hypothetical protein
MRLDPRLTRGPVLAAAGLYTAGVLVLLSPIVSDVIGLARNR